MTRDELVQAFTMRVDGASFAEIARKLNYSFDNVHDCMNNAYYGKHRFINGKNRKLAGVIARKFRTITAFAEACGVSDGTVRNLLRGKRILPRNLAKIQAVVGPGILDEGG